MTGSKLLISFQVVLGVCIGYLLMTSSESNKVVTKKIRRSKNKRMVLNLNKLNLNKVNLNLNKVKLNLNKVKLNQIMSDL